MSMASEQTTIEMAPVLDEDHLKTVPVHSARVDVEKAPGGGGGGVPTVSGRADEDLLRILDESTESDRASSPLLPPHQSSRELAHYEANAASTVSAVSAVSTVPPHPPLENDTANRLPPLARPELDDPDHTPESTTISVHDYDDRLLSFDDHDEHSPDVPVGDEVDAASRLGRPDPDREEHLDDGTARTRSAGDDYDGKPPIEHELDTVDYAYAYGGDLGHPKLENRFGEEVVVLPSGVSSDLNVYQQKKNLAQGMMDLALLSANANQLRYVIESPAGHPYFWPSITFICISIILQILVGIGLILNSRYNVTHDENFVKADKVNNFTVIGIFLVTIVNVFITSFSVAQPSVRA